MHVIPLERVASHGEVKTTVDHPGRMATGASVRGEWPRVTQQQLSAVSIAPRSLGLAGAGRLHRRWAAAANPQKVRGAGPPTRSRTRASQADDEGHF